jgi:hypothetical protein
MIDGARNRVSQANHWNLYREAEQQHPDLLADLTAAIRNHVAPLREINSTAAGAAILSAWPRRNDWNTAFGSRSSQLFGMVLWVTLFDDAATWKQSFENVGGSQVRIYRRA